MRAVPSWSQIMIDVSACGESRVAVSVALGFEILLVQHLEYILLSIGCSWAQLQSKLTEKFDSKLNHLSAGSDAAQLVAGASQDTHAMHTIAGSPCIQYLAIQSSTKKFAPVSASSSVCMIVVGRSSPRAGFNQFPQKPPDPLLLFQRFLIVLRLILPISVGTKRLSPSKGRMAAYGLMSPTASCNQ